MITFIIAILGVWHSAQAESLESRYLHFLAKARSSTEVGGIKDSFEQLKVVQIACEIQLQEKSVPDACYEAANLADRFDPTRSLITKDERIRKLDSLCAKAAEGLHFQHAKNRALSPSCAKSVKEAEAIRAYREEEENTPADWSDI